MQSTNEPFRRIDGILTPMKERILARRKMLAAAMLVAACDKEPDRQPPNVCLSIAYPLPDGQARVGDDAGLDPEKK